MSVLISPLLLAMLATMITVSSTQDQGSTAESCPHVELLRGRDGRDGRDGANGEKGQQGQGGPFGPPGGRGIQGPIGGLGQTGSPGERGPRGPQGIQGPPTGGATYTRWGRTACPTVQGTQLVYAGRAGGTQQDHKGGATNYICLPDDPDYLQTQAGVQGYGFVAGVEYWYAGLSSLSSFNYQNIPCAVCYVTTRSAALLIPAKTQCPTDWTLEYIGYLMIENTSTNSHSKYECVDKDPEAVPGLGGNTTPTAYLVLVESACGGVSCPPYDAEKELTCVVCSR